MRKIIVTPDQVCALQTALTSLDDKVLKTISGKPTKRVVLPSGDRTNVIHAAPLLISLDGYILCGVHIAANAYVTNRRVLAYQVASGKEIMHNVPEEAYHDHDQKIVLETFADRKMFSYPDHQLRRLVELLETPYSQASQNYRSPYELNWE